MPPEYEMVAFLAHFAGYKKAREEAERKTVEKYHPGAAIVALFPSGRINLSDLGQAHG